MRYNQSCVCGRSSSGRARPCQGRGSEFEPRRPLHKKQDHPLGGLVFCGANGIRWLETGSNSPPDCCVSENRDSQRCTPRWGASLYLSVIWCRVLSPLHQHQTATAGAQAFFNKIHVSPDAILARGRSLKLLLMETATFTTNTEGYFGYFASGAVGKKVYNIPNLDFISKERRTVCSRSRN